MSDPCCRKAASLRRRCGLFRFFPNGRSPRRPAPGPAEGSGAWPTDGERLVRIPETHGPVRRGAGKVGRPELGQHRNACCVVLVPVLATSCRRWCCTKTLPAAVKAPAELRGEVSNPWTPASQRPACIGSWGG